MAFELGIEDIVKVFSHYWFSLYLFTLKSTSPRVPELRSRHEY